MLESNSIAFKEWASVVEALGTGEQILILRKGGIHEKGKRFDVAHEEFFLFPTFEHQNAKDLLPEKEKLLKKVLTGKPGPEVLPIQYYAVVEESFWISEEETLKRLEPFHIWSWDSIHSRFEWGEKKGLFGIVVRVRSLPETLQLENLKRYGGCRSWVELEKPLATRSLQPVLPDKVFETKKREITRLVEILRA